ncbi:MAG: M48 family peptidase [Rhodocyclales bacterium CG17_big_fil_post_rev_8_21_14_2_50_68_7]|nr:MAG: M48 family peptidase [Rhodocyclales bacterium CG17_big_fil_post_rev_8_21_14_2_50_68_7]
MSLPVSGQIELPFRLPPPDGERRRIVVGREVVEYALRRARRRGIGLAIDQRGLRVGAPARASLREIEAFIEANGAWVLRKLGAWQPHGTPAPVCDGAVIPVLGHAWTLRLHRGMPAPRWDEAARVIELGSPISPREALVGALKTRAAALFHGRAHALAPLVPVEAPRIALSSAQTRWGSCNPRTGVRLNWRLVHLPIELIDYVVAHELAHLRELNHSARFWALVERVRPGCRRLRAQLNAQAAHLPCL